MNRINNLRHKVTERLRKFISRYGWEGFAALLFYPIIILATTPVRLVQTLWNCRVLVEGKNWGDYPHFNPGHVCTSLFYWARALNFYHFGRSGKVPNVGLGEYNLTKRFHYSLLSLYAYRHFGCIVLLTGMFGWWACHFLWLDQAGVNPVWALTVVFLILFSPTFYFNTFALQNYNALGWFFMPIGLYGWTTGHWALAVLAWLGASFGSFTVVFLACVLSFVGSLQTWDIMPIISVIPAGLKLLTHLWPFFKQRNHWQTMRERSKAMGLTKRDVKYARKHMKFTINRFYYLIIYGQFIVVFWMITNRVPVMILATVIIWIINSRFARFADEQSMLMLVLSVAASTMMQTSSANMYLLVSFWLLASPLPKLSGLTGPALTTVPKYKPFAIKPILQDMEDFLKPVSKGNRVLMTFDDPQGDHSEIFDGYRKLLDVPLYVAACKEIHFMPDWEGVFELNYEGAPDFWGREVEEVERQMRYWKADYVVVYQEAGMKLAKKWEKTGLKTLSHFSWGKYEKDFEPIRPYNGSTPDWWLLERKK